MASGLGKCEDCGRLTTIHLVQRLEGYRVYLCAPCKRRELARRPKRRLP